MDPFFQRREREKCSLAVEALLSSGELRLRASGVSMLPTLIPGDVLLIQTATLDHVAPGDIVLYRREDSLFVHRLIEVDLPAAQFVTRGDSMASPDPDGARCLLGKVIMIERAGRTRPVARRLKAATKWIGALLCHSNRARNLFLHWQSSRMRTSVLAGDSVTVCE